MVRHFYEAHGLVCPLTGFPCRLTFGGMSATLSNIPKVYSRVYILQALVSVYAARNSEIVGDLIH